MDNADEAKKWLQIAIRRHERHMAGKEPTTGGEGEISQKLMMEEMKYALDAIVKGWAITSLWYDSNIVKFPDTPKSM